MKTGLPMRSGWLLAAGAAMAAVGAARLVAKEQGRASAYATAYYLFSNDTVTYSDSVAAILDTNSTQTFTPGTGANNCGVKYNGSSWVTDPEFSSLATLVSADVINPSENTDAIPNAVFISTTGPLPGIGTTMSSFTLQTDANNNGSCFEVLNSTTYNFLKFEVTE